MSAMPHVVVPFFVVFIMSQDSTTMARTTNYSSGDCHVFWYVVSSFNGYYGPLLDGASHSIRSA